MTDLDNAKNAAARAALAELPERGIIGLGTGSTARFFIEAVATLIREGRELRGVPTSEASRVQAESLGIPLLDLEGPWDIDVTVDGADEVDPTFQLIKGGGGAHLREKIVNFASRRNVIVVDEGKLSKRLGEKWPVPVEVVRFAHGQTAAKLASAGKPILRFKEGVPFVTDAGETERTMRAIPGVVATGLFIGRADVVIVAGASGVRRLVKAPA
jgi:ribose 5-phosphate isomerase A